MKVALCVMVKNVNKYLIEFIEHYKKIGIDHIFIGDNNDIDGENIEDVIFEYLKLPTPYITIINVKNQKNLQCIFYEYTYKAYNKSFDWMCFFDIDEFLELTIDDNIHDYLSRPIFNDAEQIHINWLMFGDNNRIKYDPLDVQRRFTTPMPIELTTENLAIKSILRCNINKNVMMINPHTFINYVNPIITVNNNGIIMQDIWGACDVGNNYELAFLKHYVYKSLEEFLDLKCDIFYTDNYQLSIDWRGRSLDKYKEDNGWDDEKEEFFNEYVKKHKKNENSI